MLSFGSGWTGRLIHALTWGVADGVSVARVSVCASSSFVGVDEAELVRVAFAVAVTVPVGGMSYRGVGTNREGVSDGVAVGGGVACGVQAVRRTTKIRITYRFISSI